MQTNSMIIYIRISISIFATNEQFLFQSSTSIGYKHINALHINLSCDMNINRMELDNYKNNLQIYCRELHVSHLILDVFNVFNNFCKYIIDYIHEKIK